MKLMRGVVEDNKDPDKIGRVRVRIFGIHTKNNENSTKDFNFIKTEDLPWAEVMGGNQFGLIGGVGISSILKQGTWVWVILDHNNPNKPIVLGTVIGKNTEAPKDKYNNGIGFYDPDGDFPKEDRVDDSDIHPLLLEDEDKYRYLTVLETESGHLFEIDDTPDEEKIKLTHIIGTSFTIDKDGIKLETESGHLFEIDDTPDEEKIKLTHITGTSFTIDKDGNIIFDVKGDLNINSTGDINMTATNIHLN